jgi:chemotaxis family two-component system response regulator Rcp1
LSVPEISEKRRRSRVADTQIEVLLIEDNPGDARLFREAVADCAVPVRLTVAWDGEQALNIVSHPYAKVDLIILDLNIPKISGLEFLQRFQNRNVPVVVFSSSHNAYEIRQAMELGAREFIHKPIDLPSYTATIRDLIDKWTPEGCHA